MKQDKKDVDDALERLRNVDAHEKALERMASFPGPVRQAVMTHGVSVHRMEYGRDENPLHVWRAYKICREHGLRKQEWVTDYFDRGAEKLLGVEKANKDIAKCFRG